MLNLLVRMFVPRPPGGRLLILAGLLLGWPAFGAPPAGYYLVWADEFNGSSLDTSKWNYWLAGPRRDAINTSSAVAVSGGNDISGKVQANIHWNGCGAAHKSQGSGNVGSGLNTGFHTYGFKWTPGSYDFTIDGVSTWTGGTSPVSRSTEFMILSSEVDDGSWAGDIPAGGYGNLNTSTTKMRVDYVRYYAPTNTLFWTGASSAVWTNAANWVSNQTPSATSQLTFSYLSTGNLSNVLGQDMTVNSLTVLETTSPFSVNGTHTLYLGAGGVDMISLSRDAAFNSRVVISGAPTWTIGSGRKLHVNANLAGVAGSGIITKSGKGTLVIGVSNVINKSILATQGALALSAGCSNQYGFSAAGDGGVEVSMGPSPARCASLNLTNASLIFSFRTVSNVFGAGLVVPTLNVVGSNAVNITALTLADATAWQTPVTLATSEPAEHPLIVGGFRWRTESASIGRSPA